MRKCTYYHDLIIFSVEKKLKAAQELSENFEVSVNASMINDQHKNVDSFPLSPVGLLSATHAGVLGLNPSGDLTPGHINERGEINQL